MKPIEENSELLSWCREALSDDFNRQMLPLEASNREFSRLQRKSDGHSVILMVSPPELENNRQFVRLSQVFARGNIPVPQVIKSNFQKGWFLVDDLGEKYVLSFYDDANRFNTLLKAVDLILQIQQIKDPEIEPYSRDRLSMEFDLFGDWFLAKWLGNPGQKLYSRYQKEIRDAKDYLLNAMTNQPVSCIHRDFHCKNLLVRNDSIGIIDFQDALYGPHLYDLASLLHDCYYKHSDYDIELCLEYYLQNSNFSEGIDFINAYLHLNCTGIQRQLKALGIFARLSLRDRKNTHLSFIPLVLDSLIHSTGKVPPIQTLQSLFTELKLLVQNKMETPQ